MYYTNTSGNVIIISRLRDATGKPFRLKPGEYVNLASSRWPLARVRACARLLGMYVTTGELTISAKAPNASKKTTRRRTKAKTHDSAITTDRLAEVEPQSPASSESDVEESQEPEKIKE